MKSDQQKPPLSAGEGIEGWLKQVLGHIVVKRTLSVAHRVLVQPAAPLRERPVKKFLGLPTQRSPLDHRETPFELVLLAGDQRPIVFRAEHLAERRDVPEKRTRWLHILDQTPQFNQRVLHRCRREQQHRR